MASAGGGGAWRRQGRRPHLTWRHGIFRTAALKFRLTCDVSTDLGAADVPVGAPAPVALLVPAAAVGKLKAGVMTRFPESDD